MELQWARAEDVGSSVYAVLGTWRLAAQPLSSGSTRCALNLKPCFVYKSASITRPQHVVVMSGYMVAF